MHRSIRQSLPLTLHRPNETNQSKQTTTHSGVYYWQRASREDTVQVKLETPDDEKTTQIVAVGNVSKRVLVGCLVGGLSSPFFSLLVLTHVPYPTQTAPTILQKEELERMATTLGYGEEGMVRVQGIFEAAPAAPQPQEQQQ